MKIGTLHSGIEGVGVGATAAGFELAWGIEIDQKAAAIANQNLGGHVRVMDMLDANPADFEPVDLMHDSPPCLNFSLAKKGAKESRIDIAMAHKTAEFITYHTPKFFTLENVWGYRKSQSWGIIADALTYAGFWTTVDHVNAADFGVPQTRKRMIVRAVCGGWIPPMPQPERWIGWHESIEDLIPGLPETEFAPWQLRLLPDDVKTCLFGDQKDGDKSYINHAKQGRPSQTITVSNSSKLKAFVIDGENARGGRTTIRKSDHPFITVDSSQKGDHRAWLAQGRVVKITVPCLMRFQSFPDWYQGATARGIGNSVPPLMYQKIIEQLVSENQ